MFEIQCGKCSLVETVRQVNLDDQIGQTFVTQKMNESEIEKLVSWTKDEVKKAKRKSRTVSSMKVMWKRIKDWSIRSKQEDLNAWGAEEAIQMVFFVEKEVMKKTKKIMSWASLKSTLVIFRKTMLDQGYRDWIEESPRYKMAMTTLKKIINDESKTSISKQRITEKQTSDLSKEEVKMMAMKLFLKTIQESPYELLRKTQYVSWVFACNTGMRLQDVVRLQWDQIEIENGCIKQRVNYSKSDKTGRKLDQIVIHDMYEYPADLGTAFSECIAIKKGIKGKSNFLLPKSVDIEKAASPRSLADAWDTAATELKLKKKIGAKTPKMNFLNQRYAEGASNQTIHESAHWGKSPDIRRFYIVSENGKVARN